MDGGYAGNAGAFSGDRHGTSVCRKCRSIFRRPPWNVGMPEMQEHFPAIAMDGGLSRPSMASEALGLLPIAYAGNAGAIPATNVYHQTTLPVQRFRSNVRPE